MFRLLMSRNHDGVFFSLGLRVGTSAFCFLVVDLAQYVPLADCLLSSWRNSNLFGHILEVLLHT